MPTFLLQDAMCYWSFSTASGRISAEDLQSTRWLVIRLSPNVEPSTVPMVAIIFWFKQFYKFTWEAKWMRGNMNTWEEKHMRDEMNSNRYGFHFGWKSHFGVQSDIYLCSHKLTRNETQIPSRSSAAESRLYERA